MIHNGTFVEVTHPKAGRLKVTAVPFTMTETPGRITRPSPLVGEHGPEILRELGYGAGEIEALIRTGVISVEEPPGA